VVEHEPEQIVVLSHGEILSPRAHSRNRISLSPQFLSLGYE